MGLLWKKWMNFHYLGAWVDETGKDIEVRIEKGWGALNKMETVWKSKLSRILKVRFFRTTVESVIMYGAEIWTLTRTLEKSYVDQLRDNTSFEKKTFNGEDAKQKGVRKSSSICPSK